MLFLDFQKKTQKPIVIVRFIAHGLKLHSSPTFVKQFVDRKLILRKIMDFINIPISKLP
jgi:hypothetical protein